MNELSEFVQLMQRLERVYSRMPNLAATMAVNFFKDRFRDQAWLDSTKTAWPKRKGKRRGGDKRQRGAVLVDSGRLKRSIRKVHVGADYAIIGTDVPSAKIHNEGGKIDKYVTVRQHERRKFGNVKKGTGIYNVRTRKERTRTVRAEVGNIKVRAHHRKMNVKMPQRQFMGQSAALDKRIQNMLAAELLRAMK